MPGSLDRRCSQTPLGCFVCCLRALGRSRILLASLGGVLRMCRRVRRPAVCVPAAVPPRSLGVRVLGQRRLAAFCGCVGASAGPLCACLRPSLPARGSLCARAAVGSGLSTPARPQICAGFAMPRADPPGSGCRLPLSACAGRAPRTLSRGPRVLGAVVSVSHCLFRFLVFGQLAAPATLAPASRGLTSRRSPLVGCSTGLNRPGLTAEAPRAPPGDVGCIPALAACPVLPWAVASSEVGWRVPPGLRSKGRGERLRLAVVKYPGRWESSSERTRSVKLGSVGRGGRSSSLAGAGGAQCFNSLRRVRSVSTLLALRPRQAHLPRSVGLVPIRRSRCCRAYPGRSALCLSAAVGAARAIVEVSSAPFSSGGAPLPFRELQTRASVVAFARGLPSIPGNAVFGTKALT